MDLCLPTGVCSSPSKDSIEGMIAISCTLDSQGLSHDRASASKDLQVGHGSSARRYVTCGGGEGAESGGRGLVKERAHGTRLSEKSLHSDGWR